MSRRVTIKDIAAKLGISHTTVSRALSGHHQTKETTRARVRMVAAELGYVPHAGARQMRGKRSRMIGLVIPDIQNDFYATVAKTLAEGCNEAGYQVVLSITEDDPIVEGRHIRELSEARAAGTILVPSPALRRDTAALLHGFPVVQLVRTASHLHADWLGIDDQAAIAESTRHLIDLGHRRIAYIGGNEDLSTGAARRRGYLQTFRDVGLDPDPRLIRIGTPRGGFGREAMEQLLAQTPEPTAVVTAGSRITLGVLETIERHGIAVPEDLSLVGFGDPPWFRWWRGGITTIGLPIRDIASAAGSLLVRRIRERERQGDAETTDQPSLGSYPAFLIRRGSTASP